MAPPKSTRSVSSILELLESLKNKEFSGFVPLGKVDNSKIVEALHSGFGVLDGEGYRHSLDTSAVRHALNKHSKDSIPLTESDINLIPEILSSPDEVVPSNKTKLGLDAILYKKSFGDTIFYIEEIRRGNKILAMKTMYKKRRSEGP